MIKTYKLLVTVLGIASLMIMGMSISVTNVAAQCSSPPSGSYQKTCTDIKCVGEDLKANCRKIDGKRNKNASYNSPESCDGDIANCNGNLRCTCGSNCPAGSYQKSCFCCYIKTKFNSRTEKEEQTLTCLCKNKKGKYGGETSLSNYKSCADPIWNDNGSLKCKK